MTENSGGGLVHREGTLPPAGDESWQDLIPTVEAELRRVAHAAMRRERPDHTLQTTALINEAYLRLAGSSGIEAHDRTRFLALASRVMRHVLVDHARTRARLRRGGGGERVRISLDRREGSDGAPPIEVLDLDDALRGLAAESPRSAEVVELRFFGGLTTDEVALALGVTKRTVIRDWNFARAWLLEFLSGRSGTGVADA